MEQYYADFHVHTEFSDDSVCPMEDMAARGLELGLQEICFTEHVDYGIKLDVDEADGPCRREHGVPLRNADYEKYIEKYESLRDAWQGKINLKKGLEFGVQKETIPRYESLLKKYPMDFVILSIHQIENQEFWNNVYQQGRTQKQIHDDYYEELYQVIRKYQGYSILGHLDLVKRYDPWGDYPFEKNKEIIAEILKTAIENGKGIEVNTSSFYYKLPDLQPCTEILKLYLDLGGEILTMGSDAHKAQYLGNHFKEVRQRLGALGYRYICTYEKMEPIYHSL